jgi:hypothetical protein
MPHITQSRGGKSSARRTTIFSIEGIDFPSNQDVAPLIRCDRGREIPNLAARKKKKDCLKNHEIMHKDMVGISHNGIGANWQCA